MKLRDRLQVEVMRASARFTVNYGKDLRFAGTDLPAPRRIKVPTRHGSVPVFLHRPVSVAEDLAVHVHFHGGAFLMCYPAMDDWWCRYLAATAGVAVANVDFEVAPRVAHPVAQHQAHDAAAWLAEHGHELGLEGRRVSVGGFSSGGGLAASVCLQARDSGSFSPTLQGARHPGSRSFGRASRRRRRHDLSRTAPTCAAGLAAGSGLPTRGVRLSAARRRPRWPAVRDRADR